MPSLAEGGPGWKVLRKQRQRLSPGRAGELAGQRSRVAVARVWGPNPVASALKQRPQRNCEQTWNFSKLEAGSARLLTPVLVQKAVVPVLSDTVDKVTRFCYCLINSVQYENNLTVDRQRPDN